MAVKEATSTPLCSFLTVLKKKLAYLSCVYQKEKLPKSGIVTVHVETGNLVLTTELKT